MVLLTSHLAAVHRDRAQSKQRRLWIEKLEQIPFAWGFELLWYVQLEMWTAGYTKLERDKEN